MSHTPRNESTAHRAEMVDSPLALRHIHLTFDNAHADQSARELVEEFSPQWKTEDGPLEFVRFTDGITNTLTKVMKRRPGKTQSEIDQDAILIRAYGKGTDVLIDRERELKAHNLLATLGLAPPLLARFDNGLMYRFIEGKPCTPEDLRKPEVYRPVARRIGQWHGSLPISALTRSPSPNCSAYEKHCPTKAGSQTRPFPNTWTVMQQWIDALPSNTEEEKKRNQVLDAELAELSSKFGDDPGLDGWNYIFGHCDLLSGNVIVARPTDEKSLSNGDTKEMPVNFIDYEYATPSPGAFDIANHFAEWAGFECDHGAVPTKSQRREFLQHYVASFRQHCTHDPIAPHVDEERAVNALYDQVDRFRGIPGFYWGVWALIQATISQIDFDYASYAELRLGEYWAWKAETDGSRAKEGKEMPLRERRWATD